MSRRIPANPQPHPSVPGFPSSPSTTGDIAHNALRNEDDPRLDVNPDARGYPGCEDDD